METTKILTADYLDIVFDGRNKIYGAYELRKTYKKRMGKALVITAAICLTFAAVVYIQNLFAKPKDTGIRMREETVISNLNDKKEKKLPPIIPQKSVQQIQVQTKAFVIPKVVKDIEADKTPPPTQKELEDSKISNINLDGVKNPDIVASIQAVDNNKGIVMKEKDDDNGGRPFEKVEIDASYMGGNEAWRRFLERNLNPNVPVENGAPTGKTYTVLVQFIVDIDGSLSDIKALNKAGFGMEDEAIRVIKKSGKWKPAVQNGREVKAFRKQPITFQVLEQ